MTTKATDKTHTTVVKSNHYREAKRRMNLAQKEALEAVEDAVALDPCAGHAPKSANFIRVYCKVLEHEKYMLVPYALFSSPDFAYLLDAYQFTGDPVELRNEVIWLGEEVVYAEHKAGTELFRKALEELDDTKRKESHSQIDGSTH